jgi:hypothetical protein
MANILTNPSVLILDTAANNIVTGTIAISKIRWVGATTGGHAATLTGGDGKIIWSSVASAANYVENDSFGGRPLVCGGTATLGLCVSVLASGILYIYLA